MHFQHRYVVPVHPRAAIRAHRDDVECYGARFPGIAQVTLGTASADEAGLRVPQHWQGDLRTIPAPLRPLITAERFQWRIDTCWQDDACDWSLTVPVLGTLPIIEGRYVFATVSGGTRVELTAALVFSKDEVGERLGASSWQRWLLPLLEQFVGMLFSTVLARSAQVICEHLREEAVAA